VFVDGNILLYKIFKTEMLYVIFRGPVARPRDLGTELTGYIKVQRNFVTIQTTADISKKVFCMELSRFFWVLNLV